MIAFLAQLSSHPAHTPNRQILLLRILAQKRLRLPAFSQATTTIYTYIMAITYWTPDFLAIIPWHTLPPSFIHNRVCRCYLYSIECDVLAFSSSFSFIVAKSRASSMMINSHCHHSTSSSYGPLGVTRMHGSVYGPRQFIKARVTGAYRHRYAAYAVLLHWQHEMINRSTRRTRRHTCSVSDLRLKKAR